MSEGSAASWRPFLFRYFRIASGLISPPIGRDTLRSVIGVTEEETVAWWQGQTTKQGDEGSSLGLMQLRAEAGETFISLGVHFDEARLEIGPLNSEQIYLLGKVGMSWSLPGLRWEELEPLAARFARQGVEYSFAFLLLMPFAWVTSDEDVQIVRKLLPGVLRDAFGQPDIFIAHFVDAWIISSDARNRYRWENQPGVGWISHDPFSCRGHHKPASVVKLINADLNEVLDPESVVPGEFEFSGSADPLDNPSTTFLQRNAYDRLRMMLGDWAGTYKLYMDPAGDPQVTKTAASIRLAANRRGVRVEYNWEVDGTHSEGIFLLAHDRKRHTYSCSWLDAWHMASRLMFCEGVESSDNVIRVVGSYEDGQGGPDWGWRTEFDVSHSERLIIRSYNITPKGEEALAVDAEMLRA